jgi:AraC-like DNA-binding protein
MVEPNGLEVQENVSLPCLPYAFQLACLAFTLTDSHCIFLDLAAIYNGGNNDFIALSLRDAAKHVCCSENTAARAFVDLTGKASSSVAHTDTSTAIAHMPANTR